MPGTHHTRSRARVSEYHLSSEISHLSSSAVPSPPEEGLEQRYDRDVASTVSLGGHFRAEKQPCCGLEALPMMTRSRGLGPGFARYTTDEYDQLRQQHNIMVLAGSGFDVQLLHDYRQPTDSRYEPFYRYLKMRSFDTENVIFRHMEDELRLHQRDGGHSDWSNVEAAISTALQKSPRQADRVFADRLDTA